MPKFAANLSMLFTEVPFLDRFKLAADAGFKGVEYLFPYEYEPALLKQKLVDNELQQVLFNMPPGNWASGERGIACLPDRCDEFKRGVDESIRYAKKLGCKQINCLAGLMPKGVEENELWHTLVSNLNFAVDALSAEDITLMVEAINSRVDMPGFFVDTSEKVIKLIASCGKHNLKLQYDLYHMQIMEGDLVRHIDALLPHIGHIQFADNPGRHEPGTGEMNYPFIFNQLDKMGYSGWASAEYRPKTTTEESLKWFKTQINNAR